MCLHSVFLVVVTSLEQVVIILTDLLQVVLHHARVATHVAGVDGGLQSTERNIGSFTT